ncbi:MAG: hypothetical protein PETM_02705 [Petrimonas sp.]
MELKLFWMHFDMSLCTLLIAPLMELKYTLLRRKSNLADTFNRTAYGIEIKKMSLFL